MATSRSIRYFMTPDPLTMDASATVSEAAKAMRDENIGDVLITRDGKLFGVLTDRDIVIRGIAEGFNADNTRVEEICSQHVVALGPSDTEYDALQLMRGSALRRVPIVDEGVPVGIVTLGDLAVETDPDSLLAQISREPANA